MASLRSEPHRTPARAKGYSRHVDDAHPFTASLPVKGKPSGPRGFIPETATTSAPAMSPSVAGALPRIDALEAFYAAWQNVWEEPQHNWRCEYRTEAAGWKPGDDPVIRCECGLDEFRAAAAALEGMG